MKQQRTALDPLYLAGRLTDFKSDDVGVSGLAGRQPLGSVLDERVDTQVPFWIVVESVQETPQSLLVVGDVAVAMRQVCRCQGARRAVNGLSRKGSHGETLRLQRTRFAWIGVESRRRFGIEYRVAIICPFFPVGVK